MNVHLRRRMRRSVLVLTSSSSLVAIGLALAVTGAIAFRHLQPPFAMRLGVGPEQQADTRFAEVASRYIRGRLPRSRLEVLKTDGPSASTGALDESPRIEGTPLY